jgi:hypothetical protein
VNDWYSFVQWELSSRETIDFKMIYVDIAGGDILAGLLLSQIIYWNLPGKDGSSKLRVEKEGKPWLARKHTEWHSEIRMTEDQVRRALGVLKDLLFVEVKLFKFDGAPTVHIHLNRNVVASAVKKMTAFQAAELAGIPNGSGSEPKWIWDKTQLEMGQSPKLLTETTHKDYNRELNSPCSPPAGEVTEPRKKSSASSRSKKERLFSEDGIPLPKHDPEGFLRWVQAHPKQSHFASAANEWDVLKPKREMVETLIFNVTERARKDADWVKDGGKYIPNPAAYLKGCRWLDKYTDVTVSSGPQGVTVSYQQRAPGQSQSDAEYRANVEASKRRWEAKQAQMAQQGQNLNNYEGVTIDALAI